MDAVMDRVVAVVNDLQPLAEQATPLRFEALHAQVGELSQALGLGADQLAYVLCLFAAYPLALVYQFLPNAALKHLFDVGVGVAMAQFVLGSQWVHSLVAAAVTYALVRFGPAHYAPYLVFAFNMLYLSASHIYRLYVDYMGWTLDFTGPQMLLVIKLTSFAYNYYDGVVDKTWATKGASLSPGRAKVYQARQKLALTEFPSPLEYFGYVYSFTTFLAGPAFELREYLDVTSNAKFQFQGKTKRPSSLFAAFSKFLVGAGIMAAFAIYGPLYPLSNLHDPTVAALPPLEHFKTLYITLIFCKSKYYSAWKIAEGATVLCGFGFEGFTEDGKPKGWNGVSNMDILGFELAQSFRASSRAWNKGTQNWLERYVYTRTGNSLMATYFISAFWHGFYPGYYFFFLSLPLATSVNRLAYKRLRPRFLEKDGSFGAKKKLYDVLSYLFAQLGMHYFVMPFQSMSLEYSLASLQNVYYSGHIVCIVMYIVFSLVPAPKPAKKTE